MSESIEQPELILEQGLIDQVREAWAERMEEIYTDPNTQTPLTEDRVAFIEKIRGGEKINWNTWEGDALVNLPIMRRLPIDQIEALRNLLLHF